MVSVHIDKKATQREFESTHHFSQLGMRYRRFAVKCRTCHNEYPKPIITDEVAYFVCSECGDVYEVKNYHPQTKEQLIEKIDTAFADVVLGDGIGLFEAQAIDDYESQEVQKTQREKDEKINWRSITNEALLSCRSSLSFFDADGMRFHLPAFIVGSIRGQIDDPIFHLTHLSDHAKSQLVTLTNAQKNAIIEYLTWCLTEDEFQIDCGNITRALDEFWLA